MKYILSFMALLLLGCPANQTGPRIVDTNIDATIGTLSSLTIVRAYREGSTTHLELSDGRHIVVRGYKGHHFYERTTEERQDD